MKKRPDGRFRVDVYLGLVDGKKRYKSVYGSTQKEVKLKADELRASLRKGIDVSSANDSFSIWADYWLNSKSLELSAERVNTLSTHAQIWKDCLMNESISKIKPYELQEILHSISKFNPHTGKPMAKKTVLAYKQVINAIFEFAIDNRVIDFNPASKLKIPKDAEVHQRRALDAEERKRIVEFKHRAQPSAMLMMFSGLRRGEATALQWSDIDFNNNAILVSKSYNFASKSFKAPKNGKARTVAVPQLLIDYLKTLPRISPFVLTNSNGGMMSASAWKRLYESYMTDLNIQYGKFINKPSKYSPAGVPMLIKPFSPHELRHTFCTIMYEAGVDVLTAKEQMGHADVKTTLAIYTHLSNEKKQTDINKLDDFIKSKHQLSDNSGQLTSV